MKSQKVYLLETTDNIFIPIEPIEENIFLNEIKDMGDIFKNIEAYRRKPEILVIKNYKINSSYLAKLLEYSIPMKISGALMNQTTKEIEKIVLETGDEISLRTKFKISYKPGDTYVINDLINYIEEDLSRKYPKSP